ncbi:MAG: hypothetical protein COA79_23760 [Planctomycetota bacterium]|nr:MAG: hypothetical protein COA79_23760 [Planctomycetota bacterium]
MQNKKNISGVSLALNKSMFSFNQKDKIKEKLLKPEFFIKVANTLKEREEVFRLAYQIYLEKGYLKENQSECLIQDYDFDPETVILIVKDNKNKIVGSLTMVFEDSSKLPAMKLFRKELNDIRFTKGKIAEISRLVIDKSYRNSKEILRLMINYLFIYTHHIKNYGSLAIQVNPRHVNYYKALLCFKEAGIPKACPQVQNAPAVLLSVSMSRYQSKLNYYSTASNKVKKDRSLYREFIKPDQEKLVANYLEKQVSPMTMEERIRFGYTESGNYRAVFAS